MQTTCAVLTPRAVWCRARATAGLTKLCQLLALSAWHGIAQERSAGSSGKQISALRIEISDQNFLAALYPAPINVQKEWVWERYCLLCLVAPRYTGSWLRTEH